MHVQFSEQVVCFRVTISKLVSQETRPPTICSFRPLNHPALLLGEGDDRIIRMREHVVESETWRTYFINHPKKNRSDFTLV